jgi:hypothetical protein
MAIISARISAVLLLISGLTFGNRAAADHSSDYLPRLAQQAVDSTWRELSRCGLNVFRANDPRLPMPLVPAQLAVVNRYGKLLAYYQKDYGFGIRHEFKNPNGSLPHRAQADGRNLRFVTPYAGAVATANLVVTPSGPSVQFFCQNRPIFSEHEFGMCVRQTFVTVIARQLCRFAR